MDDGAVLPALRGIEVTPFEAEGGGSMFALRDYSRIAPQDLAVTVPGCFVLAHLNGRTRVGHVRAAFARQFGTDISCAQIGDLVAALDEALFLETDRFRTAYEAKRQAYARGDARDNRARYPSAEELQAEIEALIPLKTADGPVARGVIAPHLDYARGGPCYAPVYSLLRGRPAQRYVILGTNHFGRTRSAVATRKDFVTPLGRARTDRAFLESLEEALGQSICDGELDHDAEHSVELQVHLLHACFPEREFSIVPVLCPDPSGASGTAPSDGRGPDLAAFADALGDCIGRDDQATVVIAAADFSHVGQRFGDAGPTTQEFLTEVWEFDRNLLELLAARQEDRFVELVRSAENRTRICSVGCVYALMRCLPDAHCEILHYHQAVNMPAETHVSCAAAILY